MADSIDIMLQKMRCMPVDELCKLGFLIPKKSKEQRRKEENDRRRHRTRTHSLLTASNRVKYDYRMRRINDAKELQKEQIRLRSEVCRCI
jgi:hypothetical protein